MDLFVDQNERKLRTMNQSSVERAYEKLKKKLATVVPDAELRVKAELVAEIEELKQDRNAFILGHNYRFVSHIRYLLGAKSVTRTTGIGWQNQYSIWDDIARLEGWDALFVEKEARASDPALLLNLFERVGPIEELTISMRNVKVRSFFVIRCYGYKAKYIGS